MLTFLLAAFLVLFGGFGESEAGAADHTHTYGSWTTKSRATCTSAEVQEQRCTYRYPGGAQCGSTKTRTVGSKLNHSMGNWYTSQQATCTSGGTEKRTCTRSGCSYSESRSTARLGHAFGSYTVTSKATCTADGRKVANCTRQYCGATDTITIPKTGHSYTGVKTGVAATCTTAGWEGVKCNNCGYVPSKTTLPAKGHKWQDESVISRETCTTDGSKKQKCSECGEGRTTSIPKTGHSYTGVIERLDPTCTADGWEGVKCNNCGLVPSKTVLRAKGHNWVDRYYITEPTCTTAGGMLQQCSECGDKRTDSRPAKDHSYSGVIRRVNPTCTKEGWEGVECNNCGNVPTKIVLPKTDHVLGDWEFVVSVSTEERQVYARYCTNPECGYYITGVLGIDVDPADVPSIDADHYIDYDGNGGVGHVNRTYFKGNEATVAQNGFSKKGYLFCYWNSDPGEWGTRYEAGSIMKRDYMNSLLYAIWYPIEYTVEFDLNAYGERNPSSKNVSYDSDIYSFPIPERDGYVFTGWRANVNGKELYYSAESLAAHNVIWNLTDKDGDVIRFTAEWKQNADHVSVSLYDGDTFKQSIELDKGGRKKLPSIKKYGMTNLGWTAVKNGTTVQYENGTKYTFVTNLTLYAVWDPYYEINFYDGDTLIETKGAKNGTKLKTAAAVERNYQYSKGWATTKNGSVRYDSSTSYAFGGSMNLYAVWGKFTLKYDANGGSGAPSGKTVPQWDSITISSKQPSRTGYSFDGWSFISGEGTSADFRAGDEFYAGIGTDSTQTIYAVWIPNTYTITYDYNYPGSSDSSVTKKYGQSFKLENPARTGYKFVAWKGMFDGHQLYYSADAVKKKVKNLTSIDKAVITLVAEWEELDNYNTVTLYSDGKAVAQTGVKNGKSYTLPRYINELDVAGWTSKKNGTTKEFEPGQKVKITSDRNFYAVWDQITITFDLNGGIGGPGVSSLSGPVSGIKIPSQKPTRTGYVFNGWWVKEAHAWESADFQAGETYNYGYNATLSAVWLPMTYSPLKDQLQNEYGKSIMKDKYFTEEYTSSGWQKINDKKYFIIRTVKLSESCYYTVAYIIYKDGDTIKLVDKGTGTNIIVDAKNYVLEHTGNDFGEAFAVTYDVALDVEESLIKAGIASTGPGGVIAVLTYDTATMVMDWAQSPDGGQIVFDSVSYGVGNAETFEIDFILKSEVPFSSYLDAAGYIQTALSAYLEQYAKASSNLDPYGDRDIAIATFQSKIAADGFSENIYYTGLINLIYNKLY